MTVGELKKYLSLIDDETDLTFVFTDIDHLGSEEFERYLRITTIEMHDKYCCFHGVE